MTGHFRFVLLTVLAVLAGVVPASGQTESPESPAFAATWARTDKPVVESGVDRTWMWGPQAISWVIPEEYAEAPDGQRRVQYFDKSRMEINYPDGAQDSVWYVTNGLLVVELITGRMQVGDNTFVERKPAQINVAGDPGSGPTYAVLNAHRAKPARAEGTTIIERLHADGSITIEDSLANRGVAAAHYVDSTGHTVAAPFWAFMTSRGLVYEDGQYAEDQVFIDPFYGTGFPITEAYWTRVKVGGVARDVLLQCFERRCLTYTPDNPPGWQVESGNAGRHYYQWRYGSEPTGAPAGGVTEPGADSPCDPHAGQPTTADPGQVVLADGFESNDFSQWTQVNEKGDADVLIQPDAVHRGQCALKVHVTNSSDSQAHLIKALPDDATEVWVSGWFNILVEGVSTDWNVPTFRLLSGGSRILDVSRQNGNGELFVRYPDGHGGWSIDSIGNLGLNEWHEVKIHAIANGNASTIEVWLDGAKVYSNTAAPLGAWQIDEVMVGAEHQSQEGDFAADDVVIKVAQ